MAAVDLGFRRADARRLSTLARTPTSTGMQCTLRFQSLPGRAAYGADGLVRAITAVTGTNTDLARVLCGVAFRTYQLTPDDNWAYRDAVSTREWAWGSLGMDSYGVLEALSAHAARDLRLWPIDKPATLVALAKVELSEGRVLLAQAPAEAGGPPGVWTVVTGLTTPKDTLDVDPPDGLGASASLTFDAIKGDAALPVALLTLRPPYDLAPEARLARLTDDVLAFAVRHSRSRKELHYTEELYYAAGVRAWEVTSELLEDRWQDDPALGTFLAVWLEDARVARAAAAATFRTWAATRPDGDGWAAAADAYESLVGAVPSLPTAWRDSRAALARALRDCGDVEEDAVAALHAALSGADA